MSLNPFVPFDKLGRRIFGRTLYKIQQNAIVLLENGYRQAARKDKLFWKKLEYGTIYADMQGTELVPLWEDSDPMMYVFPVDNCQVPYWKRHRIAKEEFDRLDKAGLKYRFSTEAAIEGNCVICRRQFCPGNAGFCEWCDKDFEGDDEYCSEACKRDYYEHCDLCAACGKHIAHDEEHQHHYWYFPEKTIPVHQKCHVQIHNSEKYAYLRPPPGDADRFYKKGIHAQERKERKPKKVIILPNTSPSMPKPTKQRFVSIKQRMSMDRRSREAWKRKHGR